jgi:hypothetical protein
MKSLLQRSGLQTIQISEQPTNHKVLGLTILPTSLRARLAVFGTRMLGHGYMLVALARKANPGRT